MLDFTVVRVKGLVGVVLLEHLLSSVSFGEVAVGVAEQELSIQIGYFYCVQVQNVHF